MMHEWIKRTEDAPERGYFAVSDCAGCGSRRFIGAHDGQYYQPIGVLFPTPVGAEGIPDCPGRGFSERVDIHNFTDHSLEVTIGAMGGRKYVEIRTGRL